MLWFTASSTVLHSVQGLASSALGQASTSILSSSYCWSGFECYRNNIRQEGPDGTKPWPGGRPEPEPSATVRLLRIRKCPKLLPSSFHLVFDL